VKDILCLVCLYKGEFGTLSVFAGGEYGGSMIGRMPPPIGHLGSVDILVCPECGALHSTMNGKIERTDRK
jgi:hypothetical protein